MNHKLQLEELARQKREDSVKEAFRENTIKKFKTSFIFALAEMELVFGYLWNEYEEDWDKLTDEQKRFRNLYEKLRKRVLDNGNNQIRNFDRELDNLKVDFKIFKHDIKEGCNQ